MLKCAALVLWRSPSLRTSYRAQTSRHQLADITHTSLNFATEQPSPPTPWRGPKSCRAASSVELKVTINSCWNVGNRSTEGRALRGSMLVRRLRGSRRSRHSKCDDTRRLACPTLQACWPHQYHANTVPGVLRHIVHKSCMYVLPTRDSQLVTSRCVSAPSSVGRKTARQSAAVNVAAVKLAAETGAPRKKQRDVGTMIHTGHQSSSHSTSTRTTNGTAAASQTGDEWQEGTAWQTAVASGLDDPRTARKKSMSFGRHKGKAHSKTERSE